MTFNHINKEINLKSVFQNIPLGIYVSYVEDTSCECIPAMLNDAVCQMTGFSRREIAEKFDNRFSNLVYQEDRQKYKDAINELSEFPHNISLTYRMVKKDGEIICVRDSIQSVRHEDGNVWLYACIIQEPEKVKRTNLQERRVTVETFGRFNVRVDGQPIIFHSEKSKELLALLIDRRGNYVSNREIITCLWEDELVDKVTQSRCRKVVFNLRKSLEAYGLENLVESKMKGYRRINTDMITCDLYQYLSGEEQYSNLFQGSYMDEYSWAEATLSNLIFEV